MGFANLLLGLLALLCALSSLLPQGRGLPYYAENYPEQYLLIYRSHFYDVFKSWYFIALMALLCLSMLLCTARMLRKALRGGKKALEQAETLPVTEPLSPEGLEKLRLHMAALHCREERRGGAFLYHKNDVGRWGVFLLHLSILLVLLFGAGALALPRVSDQNCRPGESLTLEDGTVIAVDSFSMKNTDGQLDYASVIRVTLPDGRESGPREIKVNYPLTVGSKKIFQWTYGVGACILARYRPDGTEQRFELDEAAFLSSDGLTGLQYLGLYEAKPREGEEGEAYVFYRIRAVSGGMLMPESTALPGDTLSAGDWDFTFCDPYYPGLRIKEMPFPLTNSLLEGAFLLMLAGLFLCFYVRPVLVKADETGYAVLGPRPEKLRLELRQLLGEKEETEA